MSVFARTVSPNSQFSHKTLLNDSLDLVKGVTTNFDMSEPKVTPAYLIGCVYTVTNCSAPGVW